MTRTHRVAEGGRIDRAQPVGFRFDGRVYSGFAGDTLASALLANGVHRVGRSIKYHRPRGILSAGPEESNALVTIDRGGGRVTPNMRATQVELYDGLTARSQNRFPSLGFTGLSLLWRHLYDPVIRRAKRLGRAPAQADPDRYLHQHVHCDVLVIGGGAVGLAAALAASATGARVILCDQQAECGGALLAEPDVTIDGWPASDWLREVIARLAASVTLLPRTTALGWDPGDLIRLVERVTEHLAEPPAGLPRERLWQVRAKRVVLAAGAIERGLVFPGNDRPGVMLADAARTYLHRYGVKVGGHVVVATADNSAYRAATDLHAAGVSIAGIVDWRAVPEGEAVAAARARGIPIHAGMTIAGTEGRGRVHSAKLSDGTGVIPCDTILMSGGWTPSVHLFGQSPGKLVFDAASGGYLPSEGAVGACAGVFDLAASLRDGTEAGGGERRSFIITGMPAMAAAGPPVAAPAHRSAFVDFRNDVTTKDLAFAADKDPVALTTFRPPHTPVTFGALGGPSRAAALAPVRLPPIGTAGGVLDDCGTWKRARCFPLEGETMEVAVTRECRAVRNAAGMLDASTLGKIEIVGPDAAAFLSCLYTGDFTSLAPGRCRYALLLGEDGFIRDDGIVGRLAADRFHATTTTEGAEFVLDHMEEFLQTAFPHLRVWLTSVTEQWAVIAVQGPSAAAVLARFIPDIDLNGMPHMSVREGHIGKIPIRLFRVSFTGESGFEVNLPPDQAQRVWDTLRQCGVTPYGTDAMQMLRAEKGYIIVGQETDGTVTPDDVGLGWTIGGSDFVGKRSLLSLPDLAKSDRKQLVALVPTDTALVLEDGAQVIASGQYPPDISAIGHVTSSYAGAALGRPFALALIADGRSLIGSTLNVVTPERSIEVAVTDAVLYDRTGERLHSPPVPLPALEDVLPAEVVRPPIARPSGAVRLTALAPTTRVSVRAVPAAGTAIGLALGVLLPTVPCRAIISRDRAALWLGPDEWLIVAPETASDLAAAISKASSGHPASVVDVSDRSRVLEIAGPRAAWCLNGFCALDLDIRAFPVGMCTRTLLGSAEITLWRIAPEVFHLDVARSLTPYVWTCLEEALLEFTDGAISVK